MAMRIVGSPLDSRQEEIQKLNFTELKRHSSVSNRELAAESHG